jgi:hypothetical protein
MKTIIAIALVLLMSGVSIAAPFIVSDPYPLTENQPESFAILVGDQTTVVPIAKTATGEAYLKYDVAGIMGKFTGTVRAYAVQWGYSTPVPFDFNIGLNAPKSLRLSMDGAPALIPGNLRDNPPPKLKSPSMK